MRVALISTGLGRVLRGFESFTSSLFSALRSQAPDLDVLLFQGREEIDRADEGNEFADGEGFQAGSSCQGDLHEVRLFMPRRHPAGWRRG